MLLAAPGQDPFLPLMVTREGQLAIELGLWNFGYYLTHAMKEKQFFELF